ncbi:hypothetical protein Taro_045538 [Colocasia esculenta]|uniref:Uncharacterized protein n=1 Tax=Colocasia esculenta TaxID=4460 RepID=A0A843X6M2_COLES|nr:hypothetical protein [Colocasia esculenta]
MRVVCRALGGMLTSALRRRRPTPSHSGRDGGVCCILNRKQFLTLVGQTELGKLCLARRRSCCGESRVIWHVGVIFGMVSPRGRRTERGRHRIVIGLRVLHEGFRPVKATGPLSRSERDRPTRRIRLLDRDMSRCGDQKATVANVAITAERIGYVYFIGVVLAGLHCSLALLCGCGAAVRPFIRDCETERLVEVLPVVMCPGGGMILVVDPWWYLVVVGVEVDWCSVEVCRVTFHVLCSYSSLEQRRLCPARGEAAVSFSGRFIVAFDSGWLVRHGNHARTAFGAWACRRRGGLGAFFDVFFR